VLTANVHRMQLRYALAPEAVAARVGKYPDDSDYEQLIEDRDIDVFAPDGSWLLSHREHAVECENYEHLVPLIAGVPGGVDGRGSAILRNIKLPSLHKDGTVSASSVHHIPTLGSLRDGFSIRFGYSGRNGLNPYGHKSGHWREYPDVFSAIHPFIRKLNAVYRSAAPEWFERQTLLSRRTPDWVIPQTCFNNVSINQNLQFAIHKDRGNFDAAVLSVLTHGEYSGCVLVFPEYLLGVRLKPGNVLVAQTRNGWHGNTALYGVPGASFRHSYVAHFHRAMLKLGTRAQEEQRRLAWLHRRDRIEPCSRS